MADVGATLKEFREQDVSVVRVRDMTVYNKDGKWWMDAPKPWRFHRHRVWTRAVHADRHVTKRCACGAFQEGGHWFFVGRDKPRVRWTPWT